MDVLFALCSRHEGSLFRGSAMTDVEARAPQKAVGNTEAVESFCSDTLRLEGNRQPEELR